jgi:hypothetical protein
MWPTWIVANGAPARNLEIIHRADPSPGSAAASLHGAPAGALRSRTWAILTQRWCHATYCLWDVGRRRPQAGLSEALKAR